MKKYVIGLDYGSDSVRAVLIDTQNGAELASKVFWYPRWKAQKYCNPGINQFRQHPLDHIEGLETTITSVIAQSAVNPESIVSICIDTTGSSPLPLAQDGTPLALLEEFKEKKQQNVLSSMIDYMSPDKEDIEDYEEFEVEYTQADIDKCGEILDEYIDALIKSNKDETLIVESVKKVILELNSLNKKCEHELIETNQREDLCQFIEDASIIAGLTKSENDITEEWREW